MITNRSLYYFLIILSFIIICMLGILIYVIMNKKNEIHHIYSEKINISNNKPTTDINKDIPVYPKQLPQYDAKEYQQIGILSANEEDKEPIVLPLFAKK